MHESMQTIETRMFLWLMACVSVNRSKLYALRAEFLQQRTNDRWVAYDFDLIVSVQGL
jgi:hypothetical protein